MRVLVIGSGGREHALVWKLAQSPLIETLFAAPGNGGTGQCARNVPIEASDIAGLAAFAKKENIDMVVPGPELPLTLGIADALAAEGIICFGPDKFCARLEGSKSFAKSIMAEAGVPTAKCRVFSDAPEAMAYARAADGPLVVKADGLAAGKGVIVASTKEEALDAIKEMLEARAFGKAGETIVIEEKLIGEEVSLLCLCDGKTARPLPSAQDHKAACDNDLGPNTGGMGAYSPAPLLPDERLEEMADLTVRPILAKLAEKGHPFVGVLYAGLMLTEKGPKVLEYNVRFGDPECQPLLARLESDLAAAMLACCKGDLSRADLRFSPRTALGVVLAAKGYPGPYAKGMPIAGLEDAGNPETLVFHSGTVNADGQIKSAGGRVLCVVALGDTLPAARKNAYAALSKISMPDSFYRKDIGNKGIARLEALHNAK